MTELNPLRLCQCMKRVAAEWGGVDFGFLVLKTRELGPKINHTLLVSGRGWHWPIKLACCGWTRIWGSPLLCDTNRNRNTHTERVRGFPLLAFSFVARHWQEQGGEGVTEIAPVAKWPPHRIVNCMNGAACGQCLRQLMLMQVSHFSCRCLTCCCCCNCCKVIAVVA